MRRQRRTLVLLDAAQTAIRKYSNAVDADLRRASDILMELREWASGRAPEPRCVERWRIIAARVFRGSREADPVAYDAAWEEFSRYYVCQLDLPDRALSIALDMAGGFGDPIDLAIEHVRSAVCDTVSGPIR